jgi:hypothetical protein
MPIRQRQAKQTAARAGAGLVPDFAGPKTPTAVYLSPDHAHLAVVTGYESLAVYRLDGELVGRKVAEAADVDPYPRVAWSDSGAALTFVSSDGEARILHIVSGKSHATTPPTSQPSAR